MEIGALDSRRTYHGHRHRLVSHRSCSRVAWSSRDLCDLKDRERERERARRGQESECTRRTRFVAVVANALIGVRGTITSQVSGLIATVTNGGNDDNRTQADARRELTNERLIGRSQSCCHHHRNLHRHRRYLLVAYHLERASDDRSITRWFSPAHLGRHHMSCRRTSYHHRHGHRLRERKRGHRHERMPGSLTVATITIWTFTCEVSWLERGTRGR